MYPTDAYPEQLLATAQDRIRELERVRERKHRRRARRHDRRAAVFAWLSPRGPLRRVRRRRGVRSSPSRGGTP